MGATDQAAGAAPLSENLPLDDIGERWLRNIVGGNPAQLPTYWVRRLLAAVDAERARVAERDALLLLLNMGIVARPDGFGYRAKHGRDLVERLRALLDEPGGPVERTRALLGGGDGAAREG